MPTSKKVALITGGTDGIGKAVARKLLTEDWEVVIVGRDPKRCENTVNELKDETSHKDISAITADLSIMSDTKKASEEFLKNHNVLDFLLLNANAIANNRVLTREGNESNFALGYLSRALMINKLQDALKSSSQAQILALISSNQSRLDFEDLTMEQNYSGMAALSRWQWAMQVYTREFNQRSSIPLNLYMPGVVKTKILAHQPLPMGLFARLVISVSGKSAENSASEIWTVVTEINETRTHGAYYDQGNRKSNPDLKTEANDGPALWELTEKLLAKYL